MAYYLQFDGVNDYVSHPLISLTSDFEIRIDFSFSDNSVNTMLLGSTTSTQTFVGIFSGAFRVRLENQNIVFSSLPSNNQRYGLIITRVGSTITAEWVGVQTLTVTQVASIPFNQIGRYATRSDWRFNGDLYRYEIDDNSTPVRDYNPTSSGGTGSALPEDINSQDGSLLGFPTDDSQWVFYSDGPSADIIAPVAIGSGESFGTTLVTTGQVLISPTAIASSEVLGSPVVQQGATFLSPIAIPTSEVVGSPIVTPLGVTLQPVVITTEGQVGEPVILAGITLISPTNIGTNESVNQPTIDLLLKQIFPDTVPPTIQVTNPNVLGGDSITIPLASRATWNAVARYLRTLNFKGQDNDVIQAWLLSEGFDLAYNDNWFDYLVSAGYIDGAYNDKYALWREGVNGVDPWILSNGTWVDNKIWVDTETWIDN